MYPSALVCPRICKRQYGEYDDLFKGNGLDDFQLVIGHWSLVIGYWLLVIGSTNDQ
jgi:hypothetical protein